MTYNKIYNGRVGQWAVCLYTAIKSFTWIFRCWCADFFIFCVCLRFFGYFFVFFLFLLTESIRFMWTMNTENTMPFVSGSKAKKRIFYFYLYSCLDRNHAWAADLFIFCCRSFVRFVFNSSFILKFHFNSIQFQDYFVAFWANLFGIREQSVDHWLNWTVNSEPCIQYSVMTLW